MAKESSKIIATFSSIAAVINKLARMIPY